MPTCNSTLAKTRIEEDELGNTGLTFHTVGLIVSSTFGLIATVIALWLIYCHATHYSRPWEQKHIIRILFMIPVYAVVSFLSFLYYPHAIYFQVIRDCYEAFAIASFFTLLCHYLAPSLHDQKEYFRSQKPRNWVWPLSWFQYCTGGRYKGLLRIPTAGLTSFNILWVGIFQYCFVHICMTFLALLTQATGRYCESSLHPAFAHIWVSLINATGVAIAMYCIIQFYAQIKPDITKNRPLLKLVCIKLVIFFSFWQNLLISFASTRVQTTPTMSYPDIKIGVPSILLCIEMAIFAALHILAFPYRPYRLDGLHALTGPGASYSGHARYKGGPGGVYAYAEAFNPWDIIKASARGFRWLFVGVRYRNEDLGYHAAVGGRGIGSGGNGINGGSGSLHPSAAASGGFGGYNARGPSSDGNASSIYSSNTKLGPVGKDGPTPLQRERHMSAEYVASVQQREQLKQLEQARGGYGHSPWQGHSPQLGHEHGVAQSGDLGDVGLPRSELSAGEDTSYHGPSTGIHVGEPKRAYYGDELPPAPMPVTMPVPPRMSFEDDGPYDGHPPYGAGHGDFGGSVSRDVSPIGGPYVGRSGHGRHRSTDEDRAGLLAEQRSEGGGRLHPPYRRS